MIHNGFHVAVCKSPAFFSSQAKTAGSVEQTGPAHGCIVNRQKTENVSFDRVELIEKQTRVRGGHDEGAIKTKVLILAACRRHPSLMTLQSATQDFSALYSVTSSVETLGTCAGSGTVGTALAMS